MDFLINNNKKIETLTKHLMPASMVLNKTDSMLLMELNVSGNERKWITKLD